MIGGDERWCSEAKRTNGGGGMVMCGSIKVREAKFRGRWHSSQGDAGKRGGTGRKIRRVFLCSREKNWRRSRWSSLRLRRTKRSVDSLFCAPGKWTNQVRQTSSAALYYSVDGNLGAAVSIGQTQLTN